MCKLFFAIIFQFAPCRGQIGIVPGHSGFNKNVTKKKQILFLKI